MRIHSNALYQTTAIKHLEQLASERSQLSEDTLMERAGCAAFVYLKWLWRDAKHIAVFCGKGNNGGDGYVVARLAHEQGYHVSLYQMAATGELSAVAQRVAQACENAGVIVKPFNKEIDLAGVDLIVDALLGTGITTPVSSDYQAAIQLINATQLPVFALDLPSGIDADSGKILGTAVRAAATMTFIGLKLGLFTGSGPAYAGEVYCDDLELDHALYQMVTPAARLIDYEEISQTLPKRSRDSHKGDFGHVLIVGGDYGMAGAVRMAGEAALRVGAGLVTVATRPEHVAVVSAVRPEIMCHGVKNADDLQPLLNKATVIVLGPGLGQSDWSKQLWNAIIKTSQPKIIDADGLNLLAQNPMQQNDWVLTPHPGEAGRLLNMTNEEIQQNRLAAASKLQQKYGGICVLKGSGTVVCGTKSLPYVCGAGNPGMASAGMGDVLSGVLGGLVAQKFNSLEAVAAGVYIHSHAADRVAYDGGERGMVALDLMPHLHRLVN